MIPPGLRPDIADAGEILTSLLTLLGRERSMCRLFPGDTLLSSVHLSRQSLAFRPPFPSVLGDVLLIIQLDRSTPSGLKIRTRTSYPKVLDPDTYHLIGGGRMEHPLTLQAVIVHIGQTVTKGHYVVYTKMTGGPGWARCDDDRVQWVSEMEALAQEAFLLVYAPPVVPQKESKKQTADQAATVGQPVTLDRGAAQHPKDSSRGQRRRSRT